MVLADETAHVFAVKPASAGIMALGFKRTVARLSRVRRRAGVGGTSAVVKIVVFAFGWKSLRRTGNLRCWRRAVGDEAAALDVAVTGVEVEQNEISARSPRAGTKCGEAPPPTLAPRSNPGAISGPRSQRLGGNRDRGQPPASTWFAAASRRAHRACGSFRIRRRSLRAPVPNLHPHFSASVSL